MALKYFKYQNKNDKNEKAYLKWYGRAVYDECVDIERIADMMQENCTVKRADILAVLSELGPTMKKFMEESKSVKLPYLGTFKYGISTEGAESESDFTAQNVKKVRVLFQPITSREAGGKTVQEICVIGIPAAAEIVATHKDYDRIPRLHYPLGVRQGL